MMGRIRTHVCVAEYHTVKEGDKEHVTPVYTQAQRKWDVYRHKNIEPPKHEEYKNPLYYFHGDSCPKPDGGKIQGDDECTWFMQIGKAVHDDIKVDIKKDVYLEVHKKDGSETPEENRFGRHDETNPNFKDTDIEKKITKETYEVLNCSEKIGIEMTHTLKCFLVGSVPKGGDWWSIDSEDSLARNKDIETIRKKYISHYGEKAWEEFKPQLKQTVDDEEKYIGKEWKIDMKLDLQKIENKTKNVGYGQTDKKSQLAAED